MSDTECKKCGVLKAIQERLLGPDPLEWHYEGGFFTCPKCYVPKGFDLSKFPSAAELFDKQTSKRLRESPNFIKAMGNISRSLLATTRENERTITFQSESGQDFVNEIIRFLRERGYVAKLEASEGIMGSGMEVTLSKYKIFVSWEMRSGKI